MYRYIFIITVSMFLGTHKLNASDNIISRYQETIKFSETGDAQVEIEVLFKSIKDSLFRIPLDYTNIDNLKFELEYVDRDTLARSIPVLYNKTNVRPFLTIDYNKNKWKELILKINFTALELLNFEKAGPGEFDAYNWNYEFTNYSVFDIDSYSVNIILPDGYNYHEVTMSQPKFSKKDPTPPYSFEETDIGNQLTMKAVKVSFGDVVSVSYIFKSTQKSIMIVIIGVILILIYLIFFRDNWKKAKELKMENLENGT